MIDDPQGSVLAVFAIFCRIGGCMMMLPGFGSFRVPMQVRLFSALAVAVGLSPMLWDIVYPRIQGTPSGYLVFVASELATGIVFGLLAHFIVLGLQFAGTAIQMMIGFNSAPGMSLLEAEPEGQLTSLISFTGVIVLFLTDFHHLIIRTLVDSYTFMPIDTGFVPRMALVSLTDTAATTFSAMLRLASPFIVYGLIFNFAVGMVNKLAPQIPIYFISIPFLLFGGLILFYFGSIDFFALFFDAFEPLYTGQGQN